MDKRYFVLILFLIFFFSISRIQAQNHPPKSLQPECKEIAIPEKPEPRGGVRSIDDVDAPLLGASEIPSLINNHDTAKRLEGKTLFVDFFVNDNVSAWTEGERNSVMTRTAQAAAWFINHKPPSWGLSINGYPESGYTACYYQQTFPGIVPDHPTGNQEYYDTCAIRQGFADWNGNGYVADDMCEWLMVNVGNTLWNNVVVLYHIDKDGQSFAYADGKQAYRGSICTVFPRLSGETEPMGVYAHEIAHLFAACDEYGTCKQDLGCSSCNNLWVGKDYGNWNCWDCNSQVDCIMWNPRVDDPSVCYYTKGSIGWLDPAPPWPVDPPYSITQEYAEYNATGNQKYHTGIDISSDNRIVRAADRGYVAQKFQNDPDYGNGIVIQHFDGVFSGTFTLYGHLASFAPGLDVGQSISRGTGIGIMNEYVHFEIKEQMLFTGEWTIDLPDGYGNHDPRVYIYPYSSTPITPVPIRVITPDGLRVRTGPDPIYAKLTTISLDQKFVAFAKNGDWYKIYLPHAKGNISGWIAGQLGGETLAIEDASATQAVVLEDWVRVRTGPGTSYAVVKTKNYLDTLRLWTGQRFVTFENSPGSGCSESWYQIYLPGNASASDGWSCGQFLDVISSGVIITIASSPSGLSFIADGFDYTTPHDFTWQPGSPHIITMRSPQSGGTGTRYVFASWNDGNSENPRIFTTPGSATTYTALFTTQYLLTTSVSPGGAGSVTVSPSSADGYYDAGTTVQLTANPASGYVFSHWMPGNLTQNPVYMVMNNPLSVTAYFSTSSSPMIAYDPTSFSFTATQGGANPLDTLYIWNSGGGTLNWTVSDNQTWLSLSPTSGSSSGEPDTVYVSVNIAGLDTGNYSGQITISALGATNTPQYVPVTLRINPSGTSINISVTPASFNFGNVVIGQSADATIIIANDSGSTATLNGNVGSLSDPYSVIFGGGSFSLPPPPPGGWSSSVCIVRFTPTSLGSFFASLTITHNATNQSSPTIVPLSGTGVQQPAGCEWQVAGTISLSGSQNLLYMAISNGKLYVGRNANLLTVIDLSSNTPIADITFGSYTSCLPRHIAVSGNRAYVALSNLGPNGKLAVVNTDNNSVDTYIPVGPEPVGVATSGNRVYVSNSVQWVSGDSATGRVLVIDKGTNTILDTIYVGKCPNCIEVDPLTSKAYVTNWGIYQNSHTWSVSVINTATNMVVRTIPTPNGPPNGVVITNNHAYITKTIDEYPSAVEVINTTTDSIVQSIPVGRVPIAAATLNQYIFVTNSQSNNVTIIDTASNTLIGTLNVGNWPYGIAVDPSSNKVYVGNHTDRTISILECQPTSVETTTELLPKEYVLHQNYPNPFNPETVIEYILPKDCYVEISIYNLVGQKVRTLFSGHQTAGQKKIVWDGQDDQGTELSSGIYFYRLQAGDYQETKQMVLLK